MSRATVMRIFQQQLGMPPRKISHTSTVRNGGCFIEKYAKDHFSESALEVGYQSEAHFSKAFKAIYGLSPSQFRKT